MITDLRTCVASVVAMPRPGAVAPMLLSPFAQNVQQEFFKAWHKNPELLEDTNLKLLDMRTLRVVLESTDRAQHWRMWVGLSDLSGYTTCGIKRWLTTPALYEGVGLRIKTIILDLARVYRGDLPMTNVTRHYLRKTELSIR